MNRLLAVALLALALPGAVSGGTPITVFAAASLTDVLPRIDNALRYSFAGSDQLALQIRQGAPADVFAAASPRYTQLLYRDGFLLRPVPFATNKLIVLVPRSNPAGIRSVYDLRRAGVKVVIGDRTVPVGTYTRQILDTLGITADVTKNVVSEEDDVILGPTSKARSLVQTLRDPAHELRQSLPGHCRDAEDLLAQRARQPFAHFIAAGQLAR